jgi:hypothetical protein
MAEERALTKQVDMSAVEAVIAKGDLKELSAAERVAYYRAVCDSTGLNPLTRPFEYIILNGKLTLYPAKGATDQLRKIHQISIDKPEVTYIDDLVQVLVTGHDPSGRADTDVGVVFLGTLKGEARANAIMKAITKAKRRLTLSMVGLGLLDELEVETVPGAQRVKVNDDGVIEGDYTTQPTSHPSSSQPGGGNGDATRSQAADPVDWNAVAKAFTQAQLPKALLEVCQNYWVLKGMNQDEVREAFRALRDDYRADPDQCLADMSDLARKAAAGESE